MISATDGELVELFPVLQKEESVRHLFIRRVPGIDVDDERHIVLPRFADIHDEIRAAHGLGGPMVSAQQVHGNEIAIVSRADAGTPIQGADGLLTQERGLVLAIYVADCGAVYLVDPVRHAIGLLHSGKKGTELGITPCAIRKMRAAFGSDPKDLIVQIGPCIRPPKYEWDFAERIREQARQAGVSQIHDCGTCTGTNVDRYYSYRVEQGKTGRLLALLALS